MSIIINNDERVFTLHTAHSTYQMKADRLGFLLHLYYGTRSEGTMDYLLTYADRGFSGNPYDAQLDRTYSLDALPQELPVWGQGDYRSPALTVRNSEGTFGCDLRYVSCRVLDGKYSLPGLPAVYAEEGDGAQTLEVCLEDSLLGISVKLLYGVLPQIDVITRAAIIENHGNEIVTLTRAFTANLDFPCGDYDLITFYGRHAMERNMQRSRLGHGEQSVGSRRGMSSHQYNPMIVLAERDATEDAGRCWSMQFVYSGGFNAIAERDQYDQTRVQMGLMDELFSYPVDPGKSFALPEVIMSYSRSGLSKLSHNLHDCIRRHVCRGAFRDIPRPVLVNSWEAAYFDFSGETILDLAKDARDLGAEMVVMDDGWFGTRVDDYRGLGDWYVNEKKLGCSLPELSDRIHELGMKFGIWIEPEMVNEESDLFREHPDWALSIPGRKPVRARNQLVLDFSRREVVDYIFKRICAVLDGSRIEYIKWDYNRSIADIHSYGAEDQGKVLYDYMLGLYRFLDQLLERYPDILIEGCSGGGGRFDAGMLYYTPQIWCSDNTDAIDRLRIQYGTSFGHPACTMGAHVSVCPNEQNGRVTPFSTRAVTAMAGTFGYELDPKKLSPEEKAQMRSQINDYHRYAKILHDGDYYRISDPFRDPFCAWEVAEKDGSAVLLCAVTLETHGNMPSLYVRFKGLTGGAMYRDETSGKQYPADALMDFGLPLEHRMEEYTSQVFYLRRVE